MDCIILDTEYTTWPGALEAAWSTPGQHREIVQIAALRVTEAFEEIDHFDIIVRPTRNRVVSEFFTELTGITQDQVDTGFPFWYAFSVLHDYTERGTLPIIVMNADEAVMRENCRLNGAEFPFPSFHRVRPFLETELGIDLKEVSSGDLHMLSDTPLLGHTHNALHDVRSMQVWLRFAQRQGWFTGLDQLPTGAPTVDPRSQGT